MKDEFMIKPELMIKPEVRLFHPVEIRQASNGGYIVNIGCKTFIVPVNKAHFFCDDLKLYLADPEKTCRLYQIKEMNAKKELGQIYDQGEEVETTTQHSL